MNDDHQMLLEQLVVNHSEVMTEITKLKHSLQKSREQLGVDI